VLLHGDARDGHLVVDVDYSLFVVFERFERNAHEVLHAARLNVLLEVVVRLVRAPVLRLRKV